MKKFSVGISALLILVLSATFLIVMAQKSGDKKIKVSERFSKKIKEKEPKFKEKLNKVEVNSKNSNSSINYKVSTLDWNKVDEYVVAYNNEYESVDDAIQAMQNAMNVPTSVYIPKTEITDLGDEAYIKVYKSDSVTLTIRKGNILLRLDSSSAKLAKRFARHLINSLEESDESQN